MRNFIQWIAAWGLGDGLLGLITLIFTFAFSGSQKPFDWLFFGLLFIGIIFWWLVFGLTIEAAPKDKTVKDE